MGITRHHQTGEYECQQLSPFLSQCEQVLFINYTASVRSGNRDLLRALCNSRNDSQDWLEGGHLVERPSQGAHLDVIIPFLRFDRAESPAEQSRRFIAAVNNHCSTVSRAGACAVVVYAAASRSMDGDSQIPESVQQCAAGRPTTVLGWSEPAAAGCLDAEPVGSSYHGRILCRLKPMSVIQHIACHDAHNNAYDLFMHVDITFLITFA
ncbi:uncharacterized protein LOC129591445 [Paramacrobiotus metropolitanus]|uniref:uncharacterized protein LOC129591445 n=1 Tax=Paramacrobiotus metropolitanus TaxID=2943436 RepID=UPI002445760B|nr:uncharacterized protein LOC129591445 [Paramacrobiotus metropolitanus]